MEESVRMGVFLGYFCEQIFKFFINMSHQQRSKGLYMHSSQHIFKTSNNLGSTKHIKMIEMLKYSVFQAQFVIMIFPICRVFLVVGSRLTFLQANKAAANLSASLIYIATWHTSKHEQVISPILQRVLNSKCKRKETDI